MSLLLVVLLSTFVAQAQPPGVQVSFYDVLTPHGDWVVTAEFGTTWRPHARDVGPDFYPYFSGGHWQYTEYGWAWESQWAWGWVPFHHGRWVFTDQHGWVWIPDDVWGPAWVEWRVGGGFTGWVPMGPPGVHRVYTSYHPRWVWLHTRRLTERDFHRGRISDAREEEAAYHASTPVPASDREPPRGPDPAVVRAAGVQVPVLTIGTPRRLAPGAVASERRVAVGPRVPAPPAARPADAPERLRPLVPAPPERKVERQQLAPPAPPPRRAEPPPQQQQRQQLAPPGRNDAQLLPGAPGGAPVESPQAAQERKKKAKDKKGGPVAPGPLKGKPGGRGGQLAPAPSR